MTSDFRRITLVSSVDGRRPWNASTQGDSRIIGVRGFAMLRYALENGIRDQGRDVERVVIDRTATPIEMLDLLAHLPKEFNGDLLYIHEGDEGYLSALGRGGDRVLYALSPDDVHFYLVTHGLLSDPLAAAA